MTGLNFGQELFPPAREILATFSFTDIAEGVGYQIYYGLRYNDTEYLLTPNLVYSETITTTVSSGFTETFQKFIDIDFDVTFNQPKNVRGIGFAAIPIGVQDKSTPEDFEYYAIVKAIHYDGSTETILATGQSVTYSQTLEQNVHEESSAIATCKLDVSAGKHFKAGETLRMTVEVWARILSGTATGVTKLAHDPKGRTIETIESPMPSTRFGNGDPGVDFEVAPTDMQFHVPFRLDLP